MSTKRATEPIRPHKKVKLSGGRSKNPKGDGMALGTKKKGSRGSRSVEIDKDVSVCYGDNKLYLKEKGGRGKVKSSTKFKSAYGTDVDGDRGSKQMNNDYKRKRVYADRDNSRDENAERPKRRVLRDDFGKERRSMRGEDNVGKERRSTRGEDNGGKERRSMRGEDNGGKERRSMRGEGDVGKERRSMRGENDVGKERRSVRGTSYDSRKLVDESRDQRTPDSGGKYVKKKMQDKKNKGASTTENDERPKRGKRVIRIDPRDITNKRRDDGISTAGHSKEKKEDTEENRSDELSKNAQFRAIEPSPSILSFVEDNLLGRRRMIELRRAGYNIELSAPLDNIPLSKSLERERIEEPIFRNKLEFFAAAKVSSSFPPPELPEIAFAGRSNVGKSSLLNALTRQWGVVRTSDKPGLTQTINFFNLGPKLSLVDLPGYGFAYAKDEVKEAWEELVKEYVSTRVGLKRVCLLIDTKWGMKPRDYELIDLMERSQTKYQVVLTKTDLVFPIDVARRAMQIEESFKANKCAVQPLMMVSSKSGAGIRTLRTVLAKIGRFAKI